MLVFPNDATAHPWCPYDAESLTPLTQNNYLSQVTCPNSLITMRPELLQGKQLNCRKAPLAISQNVNDIDQMFC